MNQGIQLICFDIDDTLTEGRSWVRLNAALGLKQEEDEMMANWYYEGVWDYSTWAQVAMKMYTKRGKATRENIEKALSDFTLRAGSQETVSYLKSKGYHVALISGSTDIYVDKVAKVLGVELAEANNILMFDSNDMLVEVKNFGNEGEAKLNHLERFCTKLGINLQECACIGDGSNDLEMFRATGHGITFKGSPVENEAWQLIEKISDLQNIF